MSRIGGSYQDWYDVDFGEVIDIRKHFFKETDIYHMISSSVTEYEWFNKIPTGKKEYIIIAEGLFMCLKEENIKTVISNLKKSLAIIPYFLMCVVFSQQRI